MANALVWIDLEMTGLQPEIDTILEIATLVTDDQLHILAEGPNLAIHVEEDVLAKMDDWNQNQHGKSGLIDRVRQSQETLASAQEKTLAFLQPFCQPKTSPLCGNSVWQDRRFLAKYMPQLDGFLHYRLIDVSTLKELAQRWYPGMPRFPKGDAHLALADIRASIDELKFYRENVFRNERSETENLKL
jgi:oligoribonuclease